MVAWPGWYPYPGIWYGGPYLSFGIGFGIGFFGGFGWGVEHWGLTGTIIGQPMAAPGTIREQHILLPELLPGWSGARRRLHPRRGPPR